VQEVDSAHFGCTLISTKALQANAEALVRGRAELLRASTATGEPTPTSGFWKQFRKGGSRVYVSPRISIGHGEYVSVWPGKDLQAPVFQYVSDYSANGKPKTAWIVPQS
jgi:hypothetical protein